jgi:hypothetical protein
MKWTNQSKTKQTWASFTTPTDKTITLPPRRYILITKTTHEISDHQLQEATAMIEEFHTLSRAPEPMARYTSHLQIFYVVEDRSLIVISLTNTSSRIIRQQIFTQLLRILNLQPAFLTIQEETETTHHQTYYTNDVPLLLTALLESRAKKEHLLAEDQNTQPWKDEMIQILSHVRPPIPETPLQ